MNYADIKLFDVANGPGVRVSLFVSGCTHHCKNCFNPETWNFDFGNPFTQVEIDHILNSCKEDYIAGITVLGGEPMEPQNQESVLELLKQFRNRYPDKTIWCYSGYTFETDILNRMVSEYPFTRELLSYIDILVDGEFIQEEKDLSLRFKGSRNQRIIDVKESLATGETVLWDEKSRYFK
jgi:anaerobic ribonucleoside-triphosphate reductase activating protein